MKSTVHRTKLECKARSACLLAPRSLDANVKHTRMYNGLQCLIQGSPKGGWHFRMIVPIMQIAGMKDAGMRALLCGQNRSKFVMPQFTTEPGYRYCVLEGPMHNRMLGYNFDCPGDPCFPMAFVEAQAQRLAAHLAAHLADGELALPNRLYMAAVAGDSAQCSGLMQQLSHLHGRLFNERIEVEARHMAACARTSKAFPAWPDASPSVPDRRCGDDCRVL